MKYLKERVPNDFKKSFFNLMCVYLNLSLIEIKKRMCLFFNDIWGERWEDFWIFDFKKKTR